MAVFGQWTKGELFPFCGEDTVSQPSRKSEVDWTSPGEWPLDYQYVLELPDDLARRAKQCLRHDAQSEALELEIWEKEVQENFEQRQFHVKAWGETMHGTLVDLPCRVESHLLPPEGLQVLYKSADVAQMLIVHREEKLPGSERHLDKRTFMWRSGLTPATQRVDQRFRGVPPSNSIFAPALIRETTTALKNRKDRNEFSYEEEVEVDEAFREKMEKEEPNSVWKPKDLPRQRERPGVEQGAPQKSASLQRKGAASEVSLRSDAHTEEQCLKLYGWSQVK